MTMRITTCILTDVLESPIFMFGPGLYCCTGFAVAEALLLDEGSQEGLG